MPSLKALNARKWWGLSANTVLFYGAVPALLGIVFAALTHPQLSAAQWPFYLVQVYSVAVVFIGWIIRDLCCAFVSRLWRPHAMSLLTATVIGALIANVFIFPVSIMFQSLFETVFLPQALHVAATRWEPLLTLQGAFVSDALVNHILPALFLWTAATMVFFHILGMPRYGYPPSAVYIALYGKEADSPESPNRSSGPALPSARPSFLSLLPGDRQRERVIAIKAEQHYVRVYTPRGEDLIHERFRSAVAEFEHHGGIQVHRSYAIHPDFIQTVSLESGNTRIAMVNGLTIPVSRSYTAVARSLRGAGHPETVAASA